MSDQIHDLQAYPSQMYQNVRNELRTGDVLYLEKKDLIEIAKYDSMKGVLADFSDNPEYNSHLWAILNKPCDMVHDPKNGRCFKSNLFLAPLIGLKTALRKNILSDVLHNESGPEPTAAVYKAYKGYLNRVTKEEMPKQPGESNQVYGARIQTRLTKILQKFKSEVDNLKGRCDDPLAVLSVFKDATDPSTPAHVSLLAFEASEEWAAENKNFVEAKVKVDETNNKLTFKDENPMFDNLCLNQLDSMGIFFYEPDPSFSSPNLDLAYVIRLEEMLTVKVSDDTRESGALVEMLLKCKRTSLKDSFSDRLLNIMGNYFSKIGTEDVLSDRVLDLYVKY